VTGPLLLAALLILQPSPPGRTSQEQQPQVEDLSESAPPDQDSTAVDSLAIESEAAPAFTSGQRSPSGALLRSAVLPGWGQFYNDRPVKGMILGTLELGLLAFLITEHASAEAARDDYYQSGDPADEASYEKHSDRRLDLIWYTSAAWLYGMLDAYVDAHLFAFDEENREFGREAGIGAILYLRF
jgi:hypothetical protein